MPAVGVGKFRSYGIDWDCPTMLPSLRSKETSNRKMFGARVSNPPLSVWVAVAVLRSALNMSVSPLLLAPGKTKGVLAQFNIGALPPNTPIVGSLPELIRYPTAVQRTFD